MHILYKYVYFSEKWPYLTETSFLEILLIFVYSFVTCYLLSFISNEKRGNSLSKETSQAKIMLQIIFENKLNFLYNPKIIHVRIIIEAVLYICIRKGKRAQLKQYFIVTTFVHWPTLRISFQKYSNWPNKQQFSPQSRSFKPLLRLFFSLRSSAWLLDSPGRQQCGKLN